MKIIILLLSLGLVASCGMHSPYSEDKSAATIYKAAKATFESGLAKDVTRLARNGGESSVKKIREAIGKSADTMIADMVVERYREVYLQISRDWASDMWKLDEKRAKILDKVKFYDKEGNRISWRPQASFHPKFDPSLGLSENRMFLNISYAYPEQHKYDKMGERLLRPSNSNQALQYKMIIDEAEKVTEKTVAIFKKRLNQVKDITADMTDSTARYKVSQKLLTKREFPHPFSSTNFLDPLDRHHVRIFEELARGKIFADPEVSSKFRKIESRIDKIIDNEEDFLKSLTP